MPKIPKKPKRPKQSSSLRTWENYEARYRDWMKKVADIKKDKAKKQALIRKYK